MPFSARKINLRVRRRSPVAAKNHSKKTTVKTEKFQSRSGLKIKTLRKEETTINNCKNCGNALTLLKVCKCFEVKVSVEKTLTNPKTSNLNSSTLSQFKVNLRESFPNNSGSNTRLQASKISQTPKKSIRENQENDIKLSTPPVVEINSDLRMKAEIAAMKLRKGQRNDGSFDRLMKEDSAEEEHETDSSSTSSEYEDSLSEEDQDNILEPAKPYPLRKKTNSSSVNSGKAVTPNRPTLSNRASSNSSTESSSESLPDLDFPVDRKWSVLSSNTKVVESSLSKKTLSGTNSSSSANGSNENRHSLRQTSVMGSSQGKSARRPTSDDVLSSKKNKAVVARSLRSSDGQLKNMDSTHSSHGTAESPSKRRLPSSSSSPDRNIRNSDKSYSKAGGPSSVQENEKSYSLRCLDKKEMRRDGLNTTTPTVVNTSAEKDIAIDASIQGVVVQKRGRGRPRKYPKIVTEESSIRIQTPPIFSTSIGAATNSTTPLTRSQRRAGQSQKSQASSSLSEELIIKAQPATSNPCSDAKQKSTSPQLIRKLTNKSLKQPRNALALRAKQSKIMAKSRVLQSNRENATWKAIKDNRERLDTSDDLLDPDSSIVLQLQPKNVEDKKRDLQIPEPQTSSQYSSYFSGGRFITTKESPKAKCDICNMTFTRRFSLTKHLLTRQHHKKMQMHRLGVSSSKPSGLRTLNKGLAHRKIKSVSNILPHMTERPYKKKIKKVDKFDEEPIKSEYLSDSDFQTRSDENCLEEEDMSIDENGDVSDESVSDEPMEKTTQLQEWISGKVLGKKEYSCDVCGENFEKKFIFSAHLWSHRVDANLICTVCNTQFTESDKFNQHIDSAHLDETKYNCPYCPSKFNRTDYLMKHVNSHKKIQGEKFLCSICDKKFLSHALFLKHLESKHLIMTNQPKVELVGNGDSSDDHKTNPKIPEFITCDPEYIEDEEETGSDNEIDPEFGDQMPDLDRDPELSEYENDPIISPEDYNREIPVENYNPYGTNQGRNSKMSRMEENILSGECSENIPMGCGYRRREGNNINGIEDVMLNPLQCKDCKKFFQNKRSLLKHVNYFTQSERYTLKHTIQKDFGKKSKQFVGMRKPAFLKNRSKLGFSALPKLIPIQSPDQKLNFQLSQVSSGTSSTALVMKNSSSFEPKIKSRPMIISPPSYSPTIGGQSSSTTNSESHNVNGNNSTLDYKLSYKPHTCELCSKTFTEKQTLDVHTWFHQKENLFSCPYCEAKCERKSDLDLHFRCHEKRTPFFLCYVCFKPFRWKKDMIRHVRRKHPEERTYRCLYCPDKFRTSDDLTNHVSDSHPEHRSFPCEHCDRRYAQKRYLILHIQTQHGIGGRPSSSLMMSPQNELQEDESLEIEGENEDDSASADNTEGISDADHTFCLNRVKVEYHL